MSKLLAPNGKPSNLTAKQYKLVRTPAFKKWFGDWENDPKNASKVVDENGEPLVVYHGTPQKNKFYDFKIVEGSDKKSKMQLLFGSHFASNLEDAKIYSKEKGNIYEVFLNIRNILDLEEHYERSNPKFNNILEIIKELKLDKKFKNSLDYVLFTDDGDYGGLSNDIQRVFLTQQMLDSYPPKKVFDTLKKKYDGICYIPYQPQGINFRSNFSKSYIAFEPNQIKLADGTNTAFDGNNPDIRFDKGGEVFNNLSKKSKEIIDANYDGRGSFGLYDFDYNKESERENYFEWLKYFKENQFKKNLSKVIKQVESDIKLKNEKEKSEIKLKYFEELIIPSLGNEVLIPKLSIYEKQVLLDPNATIESIQKGFIDAKNIIDEDGSINQSKITPSNFIEDDEINLPAFEKFVEKNPQYKGVFNDWKKILDEYMNISLKKTYAFRYPSVDDLEYLHSELIKIKKEISKNKFSKGGLIESSNIIAQVWGWFGIKF